MTPQQVTLAKLPDLKYDWLRAYTTAKEADAEAQRTKQVAYYFFPANKTYYVPVDPKAV